MKNLEENTYLCALNRVFGFSPKTGLAMISHLGSASQIFSLTNDELDQLLGPYSKYKDQICQKSAEHASMELQQLSKEGITFCGITDASYPPLLKECPDAPLGIYIKSNTRPEELWKQHSIGIVGTRDMSLYGKEWCKKIVKGLSKTVARPAIISGLALGVDIEAHRAAVETGLPTIAVMATGADQVYPYRHKAFADRLASTPGCALVTDYPPGTAPLPIHFLRRNRIIAGLSNSLLLIESKIRGGGLMTSRLAFSYDRNVYALPGRIDDTRSMGCNELIRQKIAEPITSIASLIESLDLSVATDHGEFKTGQILHLHYQGRISEKDLMMMETFLKTIRKRQGITIEEIADTLGTGYSKTAELACLLETDGFITIDLLQRCSLNLKIM